MDGSIEPELRVLLAPKNRTGSLLDTWFLVNYGPLRCQILGPQFGLDWIFRDWGWGLFIVVYLPRWCPPWPRPDWRWCCPCPWWLWSPPPPAGPGHPPPCASAGPGCKHPPAHSPGTTEIRRFRKIGFIIFFERQVNWRSVCKRWMNWWLDLKENWYPDSWSLHDLLSSKFSSENS